MSVESMSQSQKLQKTPGKSNDTIHIQKAMLDIYDSETGTLMKADGTVFGKDTEEAKAAAREIAHERRTQMRYQQLPPWERDISESVWLNDYFNVPSKGYQEPFNILKSTTEVSNGFRFACEAKGYLVYDINSKDWFAWSGTCWKKATNEPVIIAKLVHDAILEERRYFERQLSKVDEDDKVLLRQLKSVLEKMEKHYQSTGKKISIGHMIDLSASEPGMTVDFNKVYDRNLIGCRNGIIDTLKGEFIPINRITEELKNRYPIHYIDCSYISNATRPDAFLSHLEMQFTDNTTEGLNPAERSYRCSDSIRTFLRLLGYMLVAGNPERIFIFMWGKGRNGKSTTMEVLRNIFGDEYGEGTASELCVNGNDGPQPRMAEGIGRRVLSFPELSDNGSKNRGDGLISIEAMKLLSGEKSTTHFRKMGGYDGRLDILCVPIAITNDFPRFNKTLDLASLDRLRMIPHNHRITDDEIDTEILSKIMQEKDLIFSLIVNQCFVYRNGLRNQERILVEKPGLIDPPKFWVEEQARIIVGDRLYDYIKDRFRISDNPKSLEFPAIKNDYISYLLDNNIEDPKPYRDYKGYDCNYPPYTISKSATSDLKKGMVCCGYTLYESHGRRYYNAELSRAALKNWKPEARVN